MVRLETCEWSGVGGKSCMDFTLVGTHGREKAHMSANGDSWGPRKLHFRGFPSSWGPQSLGWVVGSLWPRKVRKGAILLSPGASDTERERGPPVLSPCYVGIRCTEPEVHTGVSRWITHVWSSEPWGTEDPGRLVERDLNSRRTWAAVAEDRSKAGGTWARLPGALRGSSPRRRAEARLIWPGFRPKETMRRHVLVCLRVWDHNPCSCSHPTHLTLQNRGAAQKKLS